MTTLDACRQAEVKVLRLQAQRLALQARSATNVLDKQLCLAKARLLLLRAAYIASCNNTLAATAQSVGQMQGSQAIVLRAAPMGSGGGSVNRATATGAGGGRGSSGGRGVLIAFPGVRCEVQAAPQQECREVRELTARDLEANPSVQKIAEEQVDSVACWHSAPRGILANKLRIGLFNERARIALGAFLHPLAQQLIQFFRGKRGKVD